MSNTYDPDVWFAASSPTWTAYLIEGTVNRPGARLSVDIEGKIHCTGNGAVACKNNKCWHVEKLEQYLKAEAERIRKKNESKSRYPF